MDDMDHGADELLRRALLDSGPAAAVAMRVRGLPVSDTLTVVFHGRQDLGTVQTYVAPGAHGSGEHLSGSDLMRVPCDLDLAEAGSRDEAEHLYAEQAAALRDALAAADTVLDVWREPLQDLAGDHVSARSSMRIGAKLPAHRLLPAALVASERGIIVTAVCSPRRLADGRPPMGIACAQGDVARIYSLPDDPERCLTEFFQYAAQHAREVGMRLGRDAENVRRFLQLNGEWPEPDAA